MLARPHPLGHRVDLAWDRPVPQVDTVRLVRRPWTHPEGPDDGTVVVEGPAATTLSAVDAGLRGETVHYYSLFGATGGVVDREPLDRGAATPSARYDLAGLMYGLLPAVHRRFDAARGELRAFLDLPGAQLDELYSRATTAQHLLDLDRVDGRLLPLLAAWIGWPVDRGAPVRVQRNDVRFAPDLYRAVGALPAALATTTRVTGRSARIKEYVHNVARTNQPPRLNLWVSVRDAAGAWGEPALLSTDAAPGGRATHVPDPVGALLFFHTTRRHGADVRAKRRTGGTWAPSEPVVDRPGADLHPSAARQGERTRLFWEARDPGGRWRLWVRTRTGDVWDEPAVFGPADGPDRRNPAAVADGTGGVWLFWRERSAAGWRVRWDRHDGTAWRFGDTPATLPDDAGAPVPADADLVALAHPSATAGRIWLFWARRRVAADGRRSWEIALRVKRTLDPAAADWSPVRTVPGADPGVDDREPAPLVAGADVELFWATTRGGGWSVVGARLAVATGTWSAPEAVAAGPAAHRAPLAVAVDAGETLLVHRCDGSLALTPGGQVLDARYAGSITARTGDRGALARRGTFADTGTYTCETRGGTVARDTVGVFLDAPAPAAAVERLRGVLPDVLPVSVRAQVRPP